ncbi:MAG: glycosyl transferase [Candidatus Melainabacteria bacterium RIFCSPLOWO2_02_FULL_35_15]|nr:MAG: glycosyl transferase [Candidatus Melainabacteria bacterium RIFCSPLOWO2_12_FULL_35_11]OGI13367.1 MAG: glycosyl transferase [Candidatus Melainabacteria bacterium RIFCSPLOWO2_02_FULL_35_15]
MQKIQKVSIIIPVYNEEKNIKVLLDELEYFFKGFKYLYEVVFVDDGSKDYSYSLLKEAALKNLNFKVIRLRRNYGQSAAMLAAIDYASGDVVVPLDADLQNDPNDIPKLLNLIEEGYDLVSGWRKNRQDRALDRKIPSMIANKLISFVSGIKLHDYGCSLKAYKKDILEGVRLYGELHRFLPVCASWNGAKVVELEVNHRPRMFGKSKYGLGRTYKVILDLIVLKFLSDFSTKPIYFFGGFSFVCFLFSSLLALWSVYLKIFRNIDLDGTPLLIFSAVFIIVGVQFLLMGILADLVMRTYFESQNKKTYQIKESVNLEHDYRQVSIPR